VGSQAFSFVRDFVPEPARRFCVDRHYLLAASRGALRLEVDGTAWSLPPARAAIIRAGVPIQITIPQPVTTASVLFDAEFAPPPPCNLTVVDLTPLARSLIAECSGWTDDTAPLDDYALTLFRALAAVTWKLAEHPSPARMPTGRSTEVRRALAITEERIADDPRFASDTRRCRPSNRRSATSSVRRRRSTAPASRPDGGRALRPYSSKPSYLRNSASSISPSPSP
jgi:hypothetical protein